MIDRDKVARAIAYELGDDLDHAFASKADWIDARGMKGGRFRDTNEPYRSDYLDAADAAIAAVLEQLPKAELDYAVAQLRHAYPIIERAPLKEPAEFAHGLIAPQIRRIERFLNFLQPSKQSNPAE